MSHSTTPVARANPATAFYAASRVARALGAPFEPLAIQTLSDPAQPEHTAGVLVEPDYVALTAGVDGPAPLPERLCGVVAQGLEDVRRRGALYRGGHPQQNVSGRRVIVVSDAASTGTTLRGVVASLRGRGAREIIVALPVSVVYLSLQKYIVGGLTIGGVKG